MEHESGGAVFRLPDPQLSDELGRMDEIRVELQKSLPDTGKGGFRLTESPFFLKLCPRVVFDPDDASLIKGMYLPLQYWRCLESDPSIRGSRGGKAVGFNNVGRYFDNSSFATLVAGGWVGTTTNQSQVLEAAVREILQTGRTVTLAVKTEVPKEQGSNLENVELDDPSLE
jgi:hypothetical protein